MDIDEIPHVLAFDIGNSAIHVAHVQGGEVGPIRVIPAGEREGLPAVLADLWPPIPPPRVIAVSSVNPPVLEFLERSIGQTLHEKTLVIGRDLPLPIDTDLSEPQSVGVDRLCAAAAAFDQLGVACVVADFGTAITIDCVNDEGVFLGGAILPGLRMGARSLRAETAQLPEVELSRPDWVFGKNTRQAIIGGLVFGAQGALRELVEAYATAIGHWPVVVLTGGDASLVCHDLSQSALVQAIVPDLALRGVAIAYYRSLLKP